jgi:hypothetical protein
VQQVVIEPDGPCKNGPHDQLHVKLNNRSKAPKEAIPEMEKKRGLWEFYFTTPTTVNAISRRESTTNLLQCCILRHSNAECNFANQMLD